MPTSLKPADLLTATYYELLAAEAAAREALHANRTPENMKARLNAWDSLMACIMAMPVPLKKKLGIYQARAGFASRAGQRQAAENRALSTSPRRR